MPSVRIQRKSVEYLLSFLSISRREYLFVEEGGERIRTRIMIEHLIWLVLVGLVLFVVIGPWIGR